MQKVKITVLRRTQFPELIAQYGTVPGTLCSIFEDGQEFMVEGLKKPENFCDWAWQDIQKAVMVLLFDGNFGDFSYKNKESIVTCCTDGLRPVIFLVEKVKSP